jgi:hypothetical protein
MKILPNTMTAWGTVAGALLTAVSLVVATIAYAVHVGDEATASRASDVDHETRLRAIESHVTHIDVAVTSLQGDVTWIRQNIDPRPAKPRLVEPGPDKVAAP